MSIYLKIDYLDRYQKLVRLRGIINTIGIDRDGHLITESPLQPIFSLFRSDERVLLRVERDKVLIDGEQREKHYQHWLDRSVTVEFDDYKIVVATTSTKSEIGATLQGEDLLRLLERWSVPSARLTMELLNLRRSVELYDGIELSIGASETDDALFIELEGIQPTHASFLYRGGVVTVRALCGEVEVDGAKLSHSQLELADDGIVKLLPTGVLLHLSLPK